MIGIDLIKQQVLDADLETIQQINFATNPDRDGNPKMFFIIEETKETILDFLRGTVEALWISSYPLAYVAKVFDCTVCSTILFCFNIISIQNDSI